CNRAEYNERYNSTFAIRFRQAIASARNRAVGKGWDIDIDVPYLARLFDQQDGRCFYSGRPLSLDTGSDSLVTIDRTDPNLGYVRDNVTLVTRQVNCMKTNLNQGGFIELCREVLARHGG